MNPECGSRERAQLGWGLLLFWSWSSSTPVIFPFVVLTVDARTEGAQAFWSGLDAMTLPRASLSRSLCGLRGPSHVSCPLVRGRLSHLLTNDIGLDVNIYGQTEGSEGKNKEVVCHFILQWTTFCQNSPP